MCRKYSSSADETKLLGLCGCETTDSMRLESWQWTLHCVCGSSSLHSLPLHDARLSAGAGIGTPLFHFGCLIPQCVSEPLRQTNMNYYRDEMHIRWCELLQSNHLQYVSTTKHNKIIGEKSHSPPREQRGWPRSSRRLLSSHHTSLPEDITVFVSSWIKDSLPGK